MLEDEIAIWIGIQEQIYISNSNSFSTIEFPKKCSFNILQSLFFLFSVDFYSVNTRAAKKYFYFICAQKRKGES